MLFYPRANSIYEIDSSFCLRYGFDNHSYSAINYLNPKEPLPKDFINERGAFSLGNIAIPIDAKTSDVNVYPPPELSVCGISEISIGKKRSILAWLGISYVRRFIDPNLVEKIDAIDSVFMQAHPRTIRFNNEQSPERAISRWSKVF